MGTYTFGRPTYLLKGEFVEEGRWRGRRPENNQWVYGVLLKTKDGKIKGILNENTRKIFNFNRENPALCNGVVCGIPVFESSAINEQIVWYVELARVIEDTVESYDPNKHKDYETALTFEEIQQKYDIFEKDLELYARCVHGTYMYVYGNEQVATTMSHLDVLTREREKLCEEIQIPLNSNDVTVNSLVKLLSNRFEKYKVLSMLLGKTSSYVSYEMNKREYYFDDLEFRKKHFTVALTLDGIADHYVYMVTNNKSIDIWVDDDCGVKYFNTDSRWFKMHIDVRYQSFTDSFLQTYIASVTNILKSYNEL